MKNKLSTILILLIVGAIVILLFVFGRSNTTKENIQGENSIASTTDRNVMEDSYRPERFRTPGAVLIKKTIPSGAFLRDFSPLQGGKGFLVLYVLNPTLSSVSAVLDGNDSTGWFPSWCGAGDFGQTVEGTYKLALVRDSHIVNEINIPFPDFDKWPDHNLEKPTSDGVVGYMDMNDPKGVWKSEGALTLRQPRCLLDGSYGESTCNGSGIDFLETRQLNPMDLTGDGLPYEVRFMTEYISCGNDYYVIAGYNKVIDQVMIYPVIDSEGEHPSYKNFNPRADGTVIDDSGCDHGATQHSITNFKFDQKKNGYVEYHTTESMECTW